MKKILIIGAGFLQDFVIKRAKDMGYEVLTVDADPNAVGFIHADKHAVINIIDEEACLKYAKDEQIDGVLTVATDFGVLTTSYIAQEMGLPGLDYSVAKLIKNKYEVRKKLYNEKVDDTEQAYEVKELSDIYKLSDQLTFPVMVKPCDGSGSRGASRVNSKNEFAEACKNAIASSLSKRAEVESFISGKEYGAESIVINGEIHVLAIMRKWMTNPPYYAELGHAIPTDLSEEIENKAKDCVRRAIKALGINFGSVNMDMIITDDGKVHIIDIGARMGGNMIGPCVIPYGTGIDYTAIMICSAVGDKVEIIKKPHGAVATRLLAFKEGTIKNLPKIEIIEKQFDVKIYHHMKQGMHVNEYHTNLDGCGYIVSMDKSIVKSIDKAEKALMFLKNALF